MYLRICVYTDGYIYPCSLFFSQLRRPKSNHTSLAMSTANTQIFVPNTILHLKKPGLLRKRSHSGTEAISILDDTAASCRMKK